MKLFGTEAATDLLVIGYGNTLRSDDAAGPRVADSIGALNLPGVRTISCGLLTPELAEAVSRARVVVFVDAAVDVPLELRFRRIEPADSAQIMAHATDPRTVLALARDVFGRAPSSWWLTVPAQNLGIGDEVSPMTRRGMLKAIEKLKTVARQESQG